MHLDTPPKKALVKRGFNALWRSVHRDARGMEIPTLMMLMAMVGVPLILVLIGFAQDIVGLLQEATDALKPGR